MDKNITTQTSHSVESVLNASEQHLLTMQQENELAYRIKQGDETALQQLINGNLRFVESITKQYQDKGLTHEQLFMAGKKGLEQAARKFAPERGFKFIAYAVWWIRQSILSDIRERSRSLEECPGRKSVFDQMVVNDLVTESLNKDTINHSDYYKSNKEEIDKALETLSPREQNIIRKYYGIGEAPRTLDEIGEDLNLTRERVRQIRERAIRNLRNNKGKR